jgi:hypothetical protein
MIQGSIVKPVSYDLHCFVVRVLASYCAVSQAIIPVTWSNRNNFGATMGNPHSHTAEDFNDATSIQLSS